jgi:tRNA threonylcarbamoyladenosine biosynthesis protein TsaE
MPWPAVVALQGDLGAGKTTLSQAICAGLGVTEDVTSPTFALVHEYRGTHGPVYHLDLYRLRDERDLDNIGYDEIVAGQGVVLIEWPERAAGQLPADAIRIELRHVDGAPDMRAVGRST